MNWTHPGHVRTIYDDGIYLFSAASLNKTKIINVENSTFYNEIIFGQNMHRL